MAGLNGKPFYRVAFYDRSERRTEPADGTRLIKRIPWNLVKYDQASAGEAWEPVDFGNGKPAKAWDRYYDFPKISIKIIKICPECR